MNFNIDLLPQEEQDKIKVDILASAVIFKERHNIPVCIETIENEQPQNLRKFFRDRLLYYRKLSI